MLSNSWCNANQRLKHCLIKAVMAFCCLVSSSVFAEGKAVFSSVERISIPEGLPDTTIFSLVKGEDGFIWLGTPRGLVRYDGYEFKMFNTESDFSIATSNAGNIFLDSQNRLWIGSWGQGLSVYDAHLNLLGLFEHDPEDPTSIGSNLIQVIYEDNDSRIWVGSNGGGLSSFDEETKRFTNYVNDPNDDTSLSHNRVWSIAHTREGSLWVATTDGLNRMDVDNPGKFKRYRHQTGVEGSLNNSLVRTLLTGYRQNLWVGTEAGLMELDIEKEVFIPREPPNKDIGTAITRIRDAEDGQIWVGTQKGLYLFNPLENEFIPLVSEHNFALLSHEDIRDMQMDTSGILWVTTRYAGLVKIKLTPGIFNNYQYFSSLDEKIEQIGSVYSLFQDSKGMIWVGSDHGLLLLDLDSGLVSQLEALGSEQVGTVYSMVETDNEEIWAASNKGVFFINPERTKVVAREEVFGSIKSRSLSVVYIDSKQVIWIGTVNDGLIRVKNGETKVFQYDSKDPDSISANGVQDIFEDKAGRLWFGTSGGGVNRLDPGREKFFRYIGDPTDNDSISGNAISSIYQSSNGDMWFGTQHGLDRLVETESRFIHYNTKHGLSSSNVRSIMEDEFGDLWISTDAGISQFKIDQNYFVNYDITEGLPNGSFHEDSSVLAHDTSLIFGGTAGISRVVASKIQINDHAPVTVITDVWVDDEPILLYGKIDQPLQLKPGFKSISFKVAALDFQDPESNLYKYRLAGFEERWSKPDKQRKVTFTNLSPGEYEFQARGSNNNSIWSANSAKFSIQVNRHWWENWWVRVGFILILVGLTYYLNRIRIMKLAYQKQVLEKEVSLRTKELMSAQEQLIESEKHAALSGLMAGIAHEINTPLGISVTAASAMQDKADYLTRSIEDQTLKKSEMVRQLQEISSSAEILRANIERASELIGSFKTVSVDQLSEARRTFNLKEYLEDTILSLKPRLDSANVTTVLECDDNLVISNYPGALAQIITNLVLNAVIHGLDDTENGQVTVNAKKMKDKIHMKVCDNGKGIDLDSQSKIFEPFYTTKRGQGGSGLGLHIIKNIVVVSLEGKIRCESELGKGTCFYMEFLADPPEHEHQPEDASIIQ